MNKRYFVSENGTISVHNVNLRPNNIFSEACGYASFKFANKSGSLEVIAMLKSSFVANSLKQK